MIASSARVIAGIRALMLLATIPSIILAIANLRRIMLSRWILLRRISSSGASSVSHGLLWRQRGSLGGLVDVTSSTCFSTSLAVGACKTSFALALAVGVTSLALSLACILPFADGQHSVLADVGPELLGLVFGEVASPPLLKAWWKQANCIIAVLDGSKPSVATQWVVGICSV